MKVAEKWASRVIHVLHWRTLYTGLGRLLPVFVSRSPPWPELVFRRSDDYENVAGYASRKLIACGFQDQRQTTEDLPLTELLTAFVRKEMPRNLRDSRTISELALMSILSTAPSPPQQLSEYRKLYYPFSQFDCGQYLAADKNDCCYCGLFRLSFEPRERVSQRRVVRLEAHVPPFKRPIVQKEEWAYSSRRGATCSHEGLVSGHMLVCGAVIETITAAGPWRP